MPQHFLFNPTPSHIKDTFTRCRTCGAVWCCEKSFRLQLSLVQQFRAHRLKHPKNHNSHSVDSNCPRQNFPLSQKCLFTPTTITSLGSLPQNISGPTFLLMSHKILLMTSQILFYTLLSNISEPGCYEGGSTLLLWHWNLYATPLHSITFHPSSWPS